MNTQVEVWKDIPNYEGYYQVSNLGRVKSLDRVVPHSKYGFMNVNGRLLKHCKDKDGYEFVSLHNKDKKTLFVHKLVAIAFLNHKPCGMKIIVDHINNNKLDNRVENLQLTNNRHNSSKDKIGLTSKYIGVNLHKQSNRWRARIMINKKQLSLGYFDTELEASKAYQLKLKEIKYG